MNGPYLIIAFVALIALFYFMTIRPQRKQAEKQREMHNAIEPGTRVMLTSGIYGTVTAIGDKQFVLELAPGVDITVLKQAIVRVVQPDDEEFEFADPGVEISRGDDEQGDHELEPGASSTDSVTDAPAAGQAAPSDTSHDDASTADPGNPSSDHEPGTDNKSADAKQK